eukprot:TRINITY_DN3780_c0_g7_i1.p1 TRINITY_DN3780_c0_g7~~TRINITY_DN3780_c0_g7_i1.p1  ORF type:complete len:432 (+),score=129.49 TRINITY_DN3780_c0_g7_i1:100-1395(+)
MAGSMETSNMVETYQEVMSYKPKWESLGVSGAQAALLRLLEPDAQPLKMRAMIHGDMNILQASFDAMGLQDPKAVGWILTVYQNMLREDSSCFSLFDEALKQKMQVAKPLQALLERKDRYIMDVAAWLLTAIMGYTPHYFSEADAVSVIGKIIAGGCTEQGKIDAIANLLKSDKFRASTWKQSSVSACVFGVDTKLAQAQVLYKSVFAIWLITFDKSLVGSLIPQNIVARMQDILAQSRVEKVVRITLTVVRSLLSHRELCEQILELNLLDTVQSLEFEKWRDAELYDDIREVSQQIANQVHEMSNFDRYESELNSGKLTWSSVHTSKFWGENVMKFDQNDFRALKTLATLLMNPRTDPTTLAVACHDIGEFCTLHPLGKKKVAQLAIKERVMELMTLVKDDQRELRREALLCCQKIMLNKWQDVDGSQSQ